MLFLVWHSAVVCTLLAGVKSQDRARNMDESFPDNAGPKNAWKDDPTRFGDEYLQIKIDRIPLGESPMEHRVRKWRTRALGEAKSVPPRGDTGNTNKVAETLREFDLEKDSSDLVKKTFLREEEKWDRSAPDEAGNHNNKRNNNKQRTGNREVFETTTNNIRSRCSSGTTNNRNKDESKNCEESPMRVLLLHPIYAGSHEMTLRALGEELAGRGHWVTQLRLSSNIAVPIDKRFWCGGRAEERDSATRDGQGRMEVVTISPSNTNGRYPYMSPNGTVHVPTESLWSTAVDIFKVPWTVHRIIEAHCSSLLGSPALLDALRARLFTVAVVDLLGNDCGLALARLLGIPVLGSWEIPLQAPSVRNYGVYLPLGTVPRVMTGLGQDMTLYDRLYNVLHSASAEVVLVAYYWLVDYWIQTHQPGLPGVLTLLKEVDAIVINTHRFLDYPLHLPPHVHYIGCVLCRKGRPLPEILRNWVTNSTKDSGTVVMSFGFTGFDPEVIPSDFMTEVVRGLGQLSYKVILQFDDTKLAFIPDNVKVQPWIPQQDLLAHPNTRLFISHCGMKAVSEAVYHGVPMLCVPIFADQGDVARRVQDRGLGLTLDRRTLTGEELARAAEAVIGEDRFAAVARKLSKMWKAEPEPAMDAMVRWLTTVHHFSPLTHLHPTQEHRLHLLQYTGLDAMAFLLFLSLLIATMTFYPTLWKQKWRKGMLVLHSTVKWLRIDGTGFDFAAGQQRNKQRETN